MAGMTAIGVLLARNNQSLCDFPKNPLHNNSPAMVSRPATTLHPGLRGGLDPLQCGEPRRRTICEDQDTCPKTGPTQRIPKATNAQVD